MSPMLNFILYFTLITICQAMEKREQITQLDVVDSPSDVKLEGDGIVVTRRRDDFDHQDDNDDISQNKIHDRLYKYFTNLDESVNIFLNHHELSPSSGKSVEVYTSKKQEKIEQKESLKNDTIVEETISTENIINNDHLAREFVEYALAKNNLEASEDIVVVKSQTKLKRRIQKYWKKLSKLQRRIVIGICCPCWFTILLPDLLAGILTLILILVNSALCENNNLTKGEDAQHQCQNIKLAYQVSGFSFVVLIVFRILFLFLTKSKPNQRSSVYAI